MKRLANDTGSGIKKWETHGRFTSGKSCLVRRAEHTWSAALGIAGKTWMKATKKVDGEEDDASARVEPYLDAEWESYYRYLPQLSVAANGGFPHYRKSIITSSRVTRRCFSSSYTRSRVPRNELSLSSAPWRKRQISHLKSKHS